MVVPVALRAPENMLAYILMFHLGFTSILILFLYCGLLDLITPAIFKHVICPFLSLLHVQSGTGLLGNSMI